MTNRFKPLAEKIFLRLYLSQTISLLGDAFTWVGIALLAFQFGGKNSAAMLSTALTLRVTAFIIFGPYAGVLTDRIDRKKIMYIGLVYEKIGANEFTSSKIDDTGGSALLAAGGVDINF